VGLDLLVGAHAMKRYIKVKLQIQASKSSVYCEAMCTFYRTEMSIIPFCQIFGLLKMELHKIVRLQECIQCEIQSANILNAARMIIERPEPKRSL
jgi:hypothetical protein